MKFFMESNDTDIVLTSRVRLARNIQDKPFPNIISSEYAQEIIDEVSSSLINDNSIDKTLKPIRLDNINAIQRQSLFEKHLISIDLAKNYKNGAVILNNDENISVMINEEDHIRLQVIYPGFKIKEAYEDINKIDDLIEEKVQYAYDSNLGYLTSCPTNVGTGMRASVMLHLPALTITRNISNIVNTLNQVGMTIRGIYGEGSNAMGSVYQISNQVTLGLSEEEIINNLIAVTTKVIDQEKMARKLMMEKQGQEFEDELYRSLGILRYARIMQTNECLNLLSNVRMGVEMGIIKDVKMQKLNELLLNVQPASLQIIEGKELTSRERDIVRAKVVRESLAKEGNI